MSKHCADEVVATGGDLWRWHREIELRASRCVVCQGHLATGFEPHELAVAIRQQVRLRQATVPCRPVVALQISVPSVVKEDTQVGFGKGLNKPNSLRSMPNQPWRWAARWADTSCGLTSCGPAPASRCATMLATCAHNGYG